MSIGRRLLLLYILMATLVLVLVIGANILTDRIKQEFEGLNVQTTKLIPALESIRFAASEMTAALTEYLLFSAMHERFRDAADDKSQIRDMPEHVAEELRHFQLNITGYKTALWHYAAVTAENFPAEELFVVPLHKTGYDLMQHGRDLLRIASSSPSPSEEELTMKIEMFEHAEKKFFVMVDEALASVQKKAAEREKKVNDAVATSTTSAWVSLLLTCTFIFAYGTVLTRNVTGPLNKLKRGAVALGKGDLQTRIGMTRSDEIGELSGAFDQMAQNLQKAQEAVETANIAKSDFLATMSHEIRTPMNVVMGMASVLLSSNLSDSHRWQVKIIRDSGQTMLALINDILDLSKIEGGHVELEILDFDLSELLETLDGLWLMRLEGKGLEFSACMTPGIVPVLRSDPARIRQILFNLIGNAAKFTDTGGVTLEVSQTPLDGGMLETRFTVTDTGIGIAPEAQPRIFTKFTQADSSTTRKFGGTGLGLAICKQLSDLLGGEIGFQSTEGDGSTFWFTIRCAPGDMKTINENIFANEISAIQAAETVDPLRILVAEDNMGNQILIRTLLECDGHRLDLVSDGVEAVRAVMRGSYDMVLMDIQMPEMDGITATQKIRNLPGDAGKLPIIALTANAMKSDRETYLAAGMSDYVSKPINPKILTAVISKWAVRAKLINNDRDHTPEERTSA